jgi:hypothetical protein
MTQGTVKSTQEAIDAITRMNNALVGGLLDAITSFVNDGNSLNPEIFAGPRADAFYAQWETTGPSLTQAKADLQALVDEISNANADIQTAGGNA